MRCPLIPQGVLPDQGPIHKIDVTVRAADGVEVREARNSRHNLHNGSSRRLLPTARTLPVDTPDATSAVRAAAVPTPHGAHASLVSVSRRARAAVPTCARIECVLHPEKENMVRIMLRIGAQ